MTLCKKRADFTWGNDMSFRAFSDIDDESTSEMKDAEPEVVRKVLVVDDSRLQRRILSAQLRRWGYEVLEAASGDEALSICSHDPPDIVLSDWMMPGMSGLDFCRQFRALDRETYGYFILLTSKSEKGEVARGLDVGADDFLSKPVNGSELRARIHAGERILGMERELTRKNRMVTEALEEIRKLYDTIDRDLVEARKLQLSLVRERHRSFPQADISLLLRPSGHVGGDLVGFFPAGRGRLGIYAIDVSGHGITSALMTARLASSFSAIAPDQNLALTQLENGEYAPRAPSEVIADLNRQVLQELNTENYFTLLLAIADLDTGTVTLTQAGHPNPAVLRRSGEVEYFGSGGFPVGLIEEAQYDEFEIALEPGDRLFLMSDGFTECEDESGAQLGEEGLSKMLMKCRDLRGEAFLEALVWDLQEHAGSQDFGDDVSAILMEYRGDQGR